MKIPFIKNLFRLATWFNVAFGFILLMWQHFSEKGIPPFWQLFYFIVMISFTGIPHGALDHVIAMETAQAKKTRFQLKQFLTKYIILILIYSILWILFPALSLLVFLIISAWHFGETDIRVKADKWAMTVARICWGSFVLMIILFSHPDEVKSVVLRITHQSELVEKIFYWTFVHGHMINLTLFIMAAFSVAWAHIQYKQTFEVWHFANLVLVLYLSSFLPLLPAFALYFGGWHAVKSFELIFGFLRKSEKYNHCTPFSIWKETIPMTFLAIYGLLFMAYIWNGTGWNADPIPFVFIFLSVITLPHLDVMDSMLTVK